MAIATSALSGPLIRIILKRRHPHRISVLVVQDVRTEHDGRDKPRRHSRAGSRDRAPQHLDAARIEEAAWNRERIVATGIGHGVAIPHARLDGISEPVVAVGISEAGIDFDAPDGQPAHVLFLLVTPRSDPTMQLELSADISHLFREPHCLERVAAGRKLHGAAGLGASHRLVQVKPTSAFAPRKHGLSKREADHAGDPCCARLCPFLPRFQTDHDPLARLDDKRLHQVNRRLRPLDTADIRHSNGHPVRAHAERFPVDRQRD